MTENIHGEFTERIWQADVIGCPGIDGRNHGTVHTIRWDDSEPEGEFIEWCCECGAVIKTGRYTSFAPMFSRGINAALIADYENTKVYPCFHSP